MSSVFDPDDGQVDDFLPDDPDRQLEDVVADIDDANLPTLVVEQARPPLGRGWAYDAQGGHFIPSPTGRGPLVTTGLATLDTWIDLALHTARGAHPVFDDSFGMENPYGLIGLPLATADMGTYTDDITETLKYHPRIRDVDNFEVTSDDTDDFLELTFEVTLDDSEALQVKAAWGNVNG